MVCIRQYKKDQYKRDNSKDEHTKEEVNMNATQERYCSVQDSIINSLKEIKQMQEGKKSKKTWQDYIKEKKSTSDKGE